MQRYKFYVIQHNFHHKKYTFLIFFNVYLILITQIRDKVFGKLYADKGYISQSLLGHLWNVGILPPEGDG